MTSRIIRNTQERAELIRLLENRNRFPFVVEIKSGKPRTTDQNRLQRLWLKELEEQGDMTAEEYRGYCKLHGGVPILRSENEAFREQYDKILRPLPYEHKLLLMQVPIDFPVSRLMNTSQKTRYLDWMYQKFRGLGLDLTDPEGKR